SLNAVVGAVLGLVLSELLFPSEPVPVWACAEAKTSEPAARATARIRVNIGVLLCGSIVHRRNDRCGMRFPCAYATSVWEPPSIRPKQIRRHSHYHFRFSNIDYGIAGCRCRGDGDDEVSIVAASP